MTTYLTNQKEAKDDAKSIKNSRYYFLKVIYES